VRLQVVALSLLLVPGTAAASVRLPPTVIHSLELPNGLRALFVERHEVPVVSVEVWYHVGAKDEPPGQTGFAHLFEHLMFDGTSNLGPQQFSTSIVRTGGEDNAFTTEDSTVFWETLPSTSLPVALWLEADRMRNLVISERNFQNELQVVKEERRLRFENPPYGTVVETLYHHAFTVHPYRHTVIGSVEDLNHATVGDLRAFYDRYYVPNNATLVVVGDFSLAEAQRLVREDFGPLARGSESLTPRIPVEPPQTAQRVVKLQRDVPLPAFVEGYHIPADGTPDAYPLALASKILAGGESSLIYRRLVYEKRLAVEAQASGNFTEDPNLFFVLAIMNAGHTPAEGEREVAEIMERLKAQPVSAAVLEKARNLALSDYIQNRETDEKRGEELGYDAAVLKDPNLVNTEPGRFLAVTPEDIQRVVRKYFVPSNMTLVEVYPKGAAATRAGGE
jgi:zinc protease